MDSPAVLDLETVPTEAALMAPYPEADRPHPANYKDVQKIAEWRERDLAKWQSERAKECALSARLGRIVAAGVCGLGTPDVVMLTAFEENEEAELLRELWEIIAGAGGNLVTFNGLGFDVPFFLVRSLVNGIQPTVPTRTVRDWTRRYSYGPHYDVRAVLTQWDSRTTGTLGEWADCLACGTEQDATGADVFAFYRAREFDKIAAHCRDDVLSTKALYERVSRVFGGIETPRLAKLA